jgi:acyl carrier protein
MTGEIMASLKSLIDTSEIEDIFSRDRIWSSLIRTRLVDLGITLSDEQFHIVEQQLRNFQGDISDFCRKYMRGINKELFLTEDDVKQFFQNHSNQLPETDQSKVLSSVETTVAKLQGITKKARSRYELEISEASQKVQEIWGDALDTLSLIMSVSQQAGIEFNHEFRPAESKEQDFLFEALVRLHARSHQIAFEVYCLLENGFADGAQARWRSLHECSVTACFITEKGRDVAERYLDHKGVDDYQDLGKYQESALASKHPLSDDLVQEIKRTYDGLIIKYGKAFGKKNGWAADVLAKPNPADIRFSEIEDKVNQSQWHPLYAVASHNIHSSSKGSWFRLGLTDEMQESILLAGPSDLGLSYPIYHTAISLIQTTVCLLSTRRNAHHVVLINTLVKLCDKLKEQVLDADKRAGEDPWIKRISGFHT